MLSCGGAWSNHLHALAAAGQELNIATYGLVRGLQPDKLAVTLEDCKNRGMQLIGVSRSDYSRRNETGFAEDYQKYTRAETLWVPEGGTSETAVKSCTDIGKRLNDLSLEMAFDSVWLAVGSGGTLAGIARSLHPDIDLYAVPVLKQWQAVRDKVNSYLTSQQINRINWVSGGEFGGFGRYNNEHLQFMAELESIAQIPFDPVYTSKVMRRMLELMQDQLVPVQRPLFIHTGGLQGRRSVATVVDTLKGSIQGS